MVAGQPVDGVDEDDRAQKGAGHHDGEDRPDRVGLVGRTVRAMSGVQGVSVWGWLGSESGGFRTHQSSTFGLKRASPGCARTAPAALPGSGSPGGWGS